MRSPETRESLRITEKYALERVDKPNTSPDQQNAQSEWSEHEAEYFGGYEPSGAIQRAIEIELEKEFGFRRLGPSAQERLRRMLRTNDGLDRANRLFIERFIYAYPHQTLFSREEIKRAKVLLKQPSPSQPPRPSRQRAVGVLGPLVRSRSAKPVIFGRGVIERVSARIAESAASTMRPDGTHKHPCAFRNIPHVPFAHREHPVRGNGLSPPVD